MTPDLTKCDESVAKWVSLTHMPMCNVSQSVSYCSMWANLLLLMACVVTLVIGNNDYRLCLETTHYKQHRSKSKIAFSSIKLVVRRGIARITRGWHDVAPKLNSSKRNIIMKKTNKGRLGSPLRPQQTQDWNKLKYSMKENNPIPKISPSNLEEIRYSLTR